MPTYRVRPGRHHGAQKQYKEGDLVTLTVEEATPLLDKLELVSEKDDAKVAAAQDSAAESEGDQGVLTVRHLEAQKEEPTDVKEPKNQGAEPPKAKK